VTTFDTETRHYCRNPRCRSKLPAPVANPHRAFCCRGCYSRFFARHCRVCEAEVPYREGRENRVCRRAKCRNAIQNGPQTYSWTSSGYPSAKSTTKGVKNPIKTLVKMPDVCPRRWAWQPLSEDGDWQLLDASGKQVARIGVEADQYWIAYPGCFPEPPLETLEEAARRAVSLAFAAMPDSRRRRSPVIGAAAS
jgi:hypothetical protein